MSAFQLPTGCLDAIDKLCSAFLWSGPDLNPRKAKIAWKDVCRPKEEGGLGLRNLHEVNLVSLLKLLWRILSARQSLWVNWIREHLIRQASFWSLDSRAQRAKGSWMWNKILRIRDVARPFVSHKVGNGKRTYFWYDHWSTWGCLLDITGTRGRIDMGIPDNATLEYVFARRRRRSYRSPTLNTIAEAIEAVRNTRVETEDKVLWRGRDDVFRHKFHTASTWEQIRKHWPVVPWAKGIWFTHNTPKYAFQAWVAIHDRLPTGDRMIQWGQNVSTSCVFCNHPLESRDHLFFSCPYSSEIWTNLATGLLQQHFSTTWDMVITQLTSDHTNQVGRFTIRYVFQAVLYHIWRERNSRRHGNVPIAPLLMIKNLDKNIRNRFNSIRLLGDGRYDDGLLAWLASRPP